MNYAAEGQHEQNITLADVFRRLPDIDPIVSCAKWMRKANKRWYSRTSLIRTPKGQSDVSVLVSSPWWRHSQDPTDRLECSFIEWTMKQSELRLSFLIINCYSCIEQHCIPNTYWIGYCHTIFDYCVCNYKFLVLKTNIFWNVHITGVNVGVTADRKWYIPQIIDTWSPECP